MKREPKKYIQFTAEEELFLRKRIDYLQNCCERLKWGFGAVGIDKTDLVNTAMAIERHGIEIKEKFQRR